MGSDQRAEAQRFAEEGWCVLRGLFTESEAKWYRDHYMELRKQERWGDFAGVDPASDDPLLKYPRMIHMHRWDRASLEWLLEPRLCAVLTDLLGMEPFAVQTMLYFKPPGARGQALHQDQFYLRATPGTCCAAWMALDDCDEENGCMQVVPGSHRLPVLCTIEADTSQSFTDVAVAIPPGMFAVPVEMRAGDVLFFNGQLIHGSYPNRSRDRFRRALIGHYVTGDAQRVNAFYHPALCMDGSQVELGVGSGEPEPCGKFVDRHGQPTLEMVEPHAGMKGDFTE